MMEELRAGACKYHAFWNRYESVLVLRFGPNHSNREGLNLEVTFNKAILFDLLEHLLQFHLMKSAL